MTGAQRSVGLRQHRNGRLSVAPGTDAAGALWAHAWLLHLPAEAAALVRWGEPVRLRRDTVLAPPRGQGPDWPEATLCPGGLGLRLLLHAAGEGPVDRRPAGRPQSVSIPRPLLTWLDRSLEAAVDAAWPLLARHGALALRLLDGERELAYPPPAGLWRPPAGAARLRLGSGRRTVGLLWLERPSDSAELHAAAQILGMVALRSAPAAPGLHLPQEGSTVGAAGDLAALAKRIGVRCWGSVECTAPPSPAPPSSAPSAPSAPSAAWPGPALSRRVRRAVADGAGSGPFLLEQPGAPHRPLLVVPGPRSAWVFEAPLWPARQDTATWAALLDAARSTPPAPQERPAVLDGDQAALRQSVGDAQLPATLAHLGLSFLAGHLGAGAAAYFTGMPGGAGENAAWSALVQVGALPSGLGRAVAQVAGVGNQLQTGPWTGPLPKVPAAGMVTLCPVQVGPGPVGAALVGVLAVVDDPDPPRTAALLATLAGDMARAHGRQTASGQLARSREQTFRLLGRVLEHRSQETKGHTDRVTSLALQLGLHLDLTYDELTYLRWGAYLHDIGKVAIADSVLHKPGPLSPHELHCVHTHVTIGERLLQEQDLVPREVLEIVRHHHERWDGGGYPDGLRGDAIPLLARVFAVVDVFDALTSARSYKSPWTRPAALRELRRIAGRQLDPQVVAVFQRLMRSRPLTPGLPAAPLRDALEDRTALSAD